MEEMLKNKRGITLIALVVTIVVLLILAGVSINVIINNDGLIQKSKDATRKTKVATYKEEFNVIATPEEIAYRTGEISFDSMIQNVKSKIEQKDYVEEVKQKKVLKDTVLEATTDQGIISIILSEDGMNVKEGEITAPEYADESIFNYTVNDDGNVEIKGFNFDNMEYEFIDNYSEVYPYRSIMKIKNLPILKIPETIEGKKVVKVSMANNIDKGVETNTSYRKGRFSTLPSY